MFGLAATPDILESIYRRIDPRVARALSRAVEGQELDFADGLALAETHGAELDALALTADYLRRQAVGDVVTYVTTRNIQFTNICTIGCTFCSFGVGRQSKQAYDLTIEQVVARAREAWEAGAHEVCIQGGIDPQDDPWIYRDIVRAIREALPGMHIHAFSPLEIYYGARKTGMPYRDYLLMLKEHGLNTIPGTAAEILDNDIRRLLSPHKLMVEDWREIVTTAHSVGIRSSSTMMYGHTEDPVHWVRHLMLLREIQDQTGGFTEFVPLGFVHYNTALFKLGKSRPGPTLEEDIKVHALARVMLYRRIDNVQVSWVKLGHKLAQMCLMAGANDFGGTLMEERISRSAGANHGQWTRPEEFRYLIRAIGRIPAQRNTTYSEITLEGDLPGRAPENPEHEETPVTLPSSQLIQVEG